MKKAFAVMTSLLVALACFGFLTKAQVSAAESKKFTEDPTLAEDEIPLYIMDSIYSTFPHYYDNETLPDENWQGSGRMYPWNEIKLRIAQYENGAPTGKYYAIYFTGALTHMDGNDKVPGAGKNVLVYYKDADGQVQLGRYDQGKLYEKRNAADPSLSHMNTNISGEDLYFDMSQAFKNVGDGADDGRMYLASMVFDGQGRAIRGSTGNAVFLEPGTEGAAASLMAPLFCYVDGKVVKYVEGETTPDKKMEAQVDPETGEIIMDEDGNPVMVQTDKDHMLYKRFTWAWFEKDAEGNLPEHVKVNTVGYLEEGWDKDAWDYAWEQDGGYMCIAFMGTDGSEEVLDADMLAAYNRDQKAAWVAAGNAEEEFVEAAAGSVKRNVITHFYVPAGGYTYDLGYLDRGTAIYPIYHQLFINSFHYGRSENYSGQRTVNFSSSGLYGQDYVVDGNGLRIIENNVIEVKEGMKFNPTNNVVYTGLTRYWDKGEDGSVNDVTKFVSSDSTCEFYVKVNGSTVVMPAEYESHEALVADFIKDWNEYADANGLSHITVTPSPSQTDEQVVAEFYNIVGWELAGTSASETAFTAVYAEKWGWLYEYLYNECASAVFEPVALSKGQTTSPGGLRVGLWGFLAGSEKRSVSGTWANTQWDWSGDSSQKNWKPTQWSEMLLDTTGAELDTAYEVEFRVVNNATAQESSMVLTYIVTDYYTPIIEVNQAALNISNELVDGAYVINGGLPITAKQLLTAYNGQYTELTQELAKNLKGRDITYRTTLESDTLDFNNPTEGTHLVTARVAASATKQAVAQFEVVIRDRTAPEVEVVSETVNVAYGSSFDPSIGIVSAFDNVDGNLKLAPFSWCVDLSDTPVNTTKPGQYTVKVGVYDKAGNSKNVSYRVVVAAAYASQEEVKELGDIAEENGILIAEVQEAINGIIAQITSITEKLNEEGGCGKSSGALAVSMLSAASLLVLVLRKKH